MKKLLLLLATTMLFSDNYIDTSPSKIIKKDIELLKIFDKEIYNIADSNHKAISVSKIYRFISKHRALVNDYSKVKAYIKGEVGSRTRRALSELEDNYTLVDEVTNSREYYAIAIGITYPLYDKKTEKIIRNERVLQNNKILNSIASYVDTAMNLSLLNEELKIIRLIQIRDKALVKTGMKYLDERIKTIEKLHTVRAKIATSSIKKEKLKQILLTLTTDPINLSKLL